MFLAHYCISCRTTPTKRSRQLTCQGIRPRSQIDTRLQTRYATQSTAYSEPMTRCQGQDRSQISPVQLTVSHPQPDMGTTHGHDAMRNTPKMSERSGYTSAFISSGKSRQSFPFQQRTSLNLCTAYAILMTPYHAIQRANDHLDLTSIFRASSSMSLCASSSMSLRASSSMFPSASSSTLPSASSSISLPCPSMTTSLVSSRVGIWLHLFHDGFFTLSPPQ